MWFKPALLVFLIVSFSNMSMAQTVEIDKESIQPHTNIYTMQMNGQSIGESRMQIARNGEKLLFVDHTVVPQYFIYETTIATINAETLAPIGMLGTGLMSGQVISIEYEYENDVVSGFSDFPRGASEPQGEIEIESNIPSNTIDRSTAFLLAPYLPLKSNEPYEFNWYNGFNDTVREIKMQVIGEVTIEVPHGTFETYKVEMLGGTPSQILYITKDAPHFVAKIEIINSPWVYVLNDRE